MTIQAFSEIIPDVRNEKNKIYQSNELVFISIVSVICGADTWNEIESFAKTHEDYFKKRLPGLVSVPSHDTLSRFFSILDIEWFEECFRLWVGDICRSIPGVVAIDGKAVCNSQSKTGMKSKLYMVSAWVCIQRYMSWSKESRGKIQ